MGVGSGFGKTAGGVLAPRSALSQGVPTVDPRTGNVISSGTGGGRVTGLSNVIGWTVAPPKARQTWELHRAREASRQLALTSPHWRAYIKYAGGQVLGSRPTQLSFPLLARDGRTRLRPALGTLRRRWRRYQSEKGVGMRGEDILSLRAQILYTRLVDGDCFVRPMRGEDGRPRYMFHSGDALAEVSMGPGGMTGDSRALGITTDEWGLPVTYWFGFRGRARPTGYWGWSSEVDPVPIPASSVWHMRERYEDGTTLRSYPWCTPVIDYIDKLHLYRWSFVRSAIGRASVQIFLSQHPEMGAYAAEGAGSAGQSLWQDGAPEEGGEEDEARRPLWQEDVSNAGEVMVLPPGYKAERMDTGAPSQNEYMEMRSVEMAICAGLGSSPMAILSDYKGVSYASAQHASGHERPKIEAFQAWIGNDFLTPVYRPWFASEWPSLLREHPELRPEDYEVLREATHVFRAYQPMEKHRMVKPVVEAWQSGLFTMAGSLSELGEDASDVEGRIEEWKYERSLLGLPEVPETAGRPPEPVPGEYDDGEESDAERERRERREDEEGPEGEEET